MNHSIEEFAEAVLTTPDSFATSDEAAFTTHGCVYSTHRDADVLAVSNWHAFCAELGITYNGRSAADGESDDVYIMGCGHWAVGWMDQLMVRVYKPAPRDNGFTDSFNDTATATLRAHPTQADPELVYTDEFIKAWELHEALASYPVLDEDDYSEREYNDLIETLVACYDVPADLAHECRDYIEVSSSEELGYAERLLNLWKLSYVPIELGSYIHGNLDRFGYAEAYAAHQEATR